MNPLTEAFVGLRVILDQQSCWRQVDPSKGFNCVQRSGKTLQFAHPYLRTVQAPSRSAADTLLFFYSDVPLNPYSSVLLPLNAISGAHAHGKADILFRIGYRILYFNKACFLVLAEHGRAKTYTGFAIRAFGTVNVGGPSILLFLPLEISPVCERSPQRKLLFFHRSLPAQAAAILAARLAAGAVTTFLPFLRHGRPALSDLM